MNLPYDANTRLSDILETYPWLARELPKLDERAKVLSSPLIRPLLKRMTVADLSRETGYTTEKLLRKLGKVIEEHERT